ncbi:PPC domain-containing DNA-binding protein [Saccharothrix violaceirubra]|uniref:PPC domain-containing DNA-binding protein n=1 Tax=Saccharothrix violaceirubra TaxID=413306 RepID=UPI001FECE587|nr:PPC domain-containing DNA-binding protein [Saccharothrix violaceirubra]
MGRTFAVVFDHQDDFFPALDDFCRHNNVRHAFVPGFIAGFSQADLVATCTPPDDPHAPVWDSIRLDHVEALGSGTLAYDQTTDSVHPHIHVAVGRKHHNATGHTSHLLAAHVQFLTEMLIVEVTDPELHRRRNPDLYDVPQLHFHPR